MKPRLAGIFFLITLLISCQDYTPKPIGYNRIEPKETPKVEFSFPKFSFQYPSTVHIDSLKAPHRGEFWFNIVYPQYGATVYCTYLPITPSSLAQALDDSYQMAYSHSLMANGIDQHLFTNTHEKVSGILYRIGGDVATPAQFFVTDSISNFLRGSFYYSTNVKADSIAPITEFITKDIEGLISTFRWK